MISSPKSQLIREIIEKLPDSVQGGHIQPLLSSVYECKSSASIGFFTFENGKLVNHSFILNKNPTKQSKLFFCASGTKIVTSFLFFQTLKNLQKSTDLESPIEDLFPGFCEKHLLPTQIGQIKIGDLIYSKTNLANYRASKDLSLKILALNQIFGLAETDEKDEYSDTNYVLMAKLIEYKERKTLREMFHEHLVKPNDLKGIDMIQASSEFKGDLQSMIEAGTLSFQEHDQLDKLRNKIDENLIYFNNAVGAGNLVVQDLLTMVRMRDIIEKSEFGRFIFQGSQKVLSIELSPAKGSVVYAAGGMSQHTLDDAVISEFFSARIFNENIFYVKKALSKEQYLIVAFYYSGEDLDFYKMGRLILKCALDIPGKSNEKRLKGGHNVK